MCYSNSVLSGNVRGQEGQGKNLAETSVVSSDGMCACVDGIAGCDGSTVESGCAGWPGEDGPGHDMAGAGAFDQRPLFTTVFSLSNTTAGDHGAGEEVRREGDDGGVVISPRSLISSTG